MPDRPSISCLMVTRPSPDRFERFCSSVADYLRQTHASRELVIVIDPRAEALEVGRVASQLASLGRDDIRIVAPERMGSLGGLRNLSVAAARGNLLCIWDDDDRRHPDCLASQASALGRSGADGVCLQHAAHYFARERRLYVANWLKTEATGLPSSLMCRRDAGIAYPETGADADLGEDLAPLRQLKAGRGLARLADAPHLYVYVFHGGNSWDEAHHRWLVDELAITEGLLRRREADLRAGLAAFDFGPGAVMVEGRAGSAFQIG